jgi:hypothetical protein
LSAARSWLRGSALKRQAGGIEPARLTPSFIGGNETQQRRTANCRHSTGNRLPQATSYNNTPQSNPQSSGKRREQDAMTVTIIANHKTTTVADGSSIFISGFGDTLFTNGSSITFGDDSNVRVNGNNNQLTLGSSTIVKASGQGDSVTITGTNDQVSGAASVTLTGNNNSAVDVAFGSTATITGQFNTLTFDDAGGGTVTTLGNTDTVVLDSAGTNTVVADGAAGEAGSGETLISMVHLGGNAIIVGIDNAIVTMENNRETVTISNGEINAVTIDGAADIVKTTGGSTVLATVSTGGVGEVDADNSSVTLNDNATATVNGSNDDLLVANGATLVANGTNNNVRVTGVNNMIAASNAAVNFFGDGTSAVVVGGGDSVTLSSLGAIGETLTMVGDGNTIAVGSANDTVNLFGTGNTITTTSATSITLSHDGATATVNGSGNSLTFEGNQQTVNLNGAGNAVDVVDSADNTVNSSGVAAVTLEVGASANVNASDSTITINDNSAVSVVGNNDQIATDESSTGATAVQVNGTGDVVTDRAFSSGGQMQLTNGSPANAGPTNELALGEPAAPVSDTQLWFQESGNDLNIVLLGSQNEVTVANWFASPGNQLQAIHAGGMTLDNGAVGQLVQPMATFAGANPGFDPTSASGAVQAHNDPGVQSAILAAWHG